MNFVEFLQQYHPHFERDLGEFKDNTRRFAGRDISTEEKMGFLISMFDEAFEVYNAPKEEEPEGGKDENTDS